MASGDDAPIRVDRSRLWFSWGLLVSAVVATGAVVGIYVRFDTGQTIVEKRLDSLESSAAKGSDAMVGMAKVMDKLSQDVARALADPWSGTDMRFWVSEFRRLNPDEPLPDATRITGGDGR